MNRNIIKRILYVMLFICFTEVATAQIAIVVNNNNPINDISITELKQIYLGKRTTFADEPNVLLAQHSEIKEKFYDDLLGWSLMKYNKHWMKLIFSGESYTTPKDFDRPDDLKEFVSKNVNAIAFIIHSDADDNVKILTVDGKTHLNNDYTFK